MGRLTSHASSQASSLLPGTSTPWQRGYGPGWRRSPRLGAVPRKDAIRINGHLGATVLPAFPVLVPQPHGVDTVLTGLLDRPALYGVLAELEAFGLELVEVRQLSPQRKSQESGDGCSPGWPLASGAPEPCYEKVPPR